MRKGELKKQEILKTAEQLFCKNGYEQTSVQDILDVLRTSKGSFYHHYESKESLLEAMCGFRAAASAEETGKLLAQESGTMRKINRLFSGMMPLDGERLSFLLMLLPVFGTAEGRSVRNAYRESLTAAFREPLTGLLEQGTADGTLYCPEQERTAVICLSLVNDVWCEACDTILSVEREGTMADAGRLLTILEPYRVSLERILYAPFGSIELLKLQDLKLLSDQIHVHWKR